MQKIIEQIKKYKLGISTFFIVLIIGIIAILLFTTNINEIKEFSNEYYSFSYDKSWKIKNATNNMVELKHKSNSVIEIEIVDLKDEYRYSTMEDILDEFLYSVQQQNTTYKLLAQEDCKVTKFEYDGFKLLYENGEEQALLYVCKVSDKLIIFNFESDNLHFDILLDSVQNIIYNFNISSEKFELSHKILVDTTQITYSQNDELSKEMSLTEYEIAYENYLVNYSIPSGFELSSFDSQYNFFNYRELEEGDITLTANIYNKNIYEYLEKDELIGTIYSDNNHIREGEDSDYTDFKEDLSKLNEEENSYIYKASYTYKGVMSDIKYENITIVYTLDENHIFILDLEARNVSIPEDFINKIIINNYENYSSYIKRNVIDGNVIGTLKRYTDYNREKIDEVTIKIPEKYSEIDEGYNNLYEDRAYGLNYNEETDVWQYLVNYTLTSDSRTIESQLELQSSMYKTSYGQGRDLTYSKDITLNGRNFKVYDGMYIDITNTIFNRVRFEANVKNLFYQLDNGGYLVIEIIGNGVEISDEVLNEVTNFDIETKDI